LRGDRLLREVGGNQAALRELHQDRRQRLEISTVGARARKRTPEQPVGLDRTQLRQIKSLVHRTDKVVPGPVAAQDRRDRDEERLRSDGIRPVEIEGDAGRLLIGRRGLGLVIDHNAGLQAAGRRRADDQQ